MPGPYVVPVHGDETLPDACDVVVIGGGIVGCSTALELAERGLKVVLCEKGGIGQEQSSRNWGWVRISMRDPREVPLMAEALRIWDNLEDYQIDTRMLSAREFGDLFPGSKLPMAGALYTPADGRAEPQKAAPAIAEAARD